MWKKKLVLALSGQFERPYTEQVRMIHDAGFEGFFSGWEQGCDLTSLRREADRLGMLYQSVHAPFGTIADMWKDGLKGEACLEEQLACLKDCSRIGVDMMVCHTYIGFEDEGKVTKAGLKNFGRLIEESGKLGVRIAFENTEGEKSLAGLLDYFKEDHVGFCFDSGHELCYNRGKDMLDLYGNRLFGTHLNDNLGISSFNGNIFWTDDLHLLPFDGIADWEGIAQRLNRCNFEGPLTFELNTKSKPDRHENDLYSHMPLEEYLAAAYTRACRVAALVLKEKKENEDHSL